jgi:hypothetical protein
LFSELGNGLLELAPPVAQVLDQPALADLLRVLGELAVVAEERGDEVAA